MDHETARGLPPQLLYLPLVLLAFLLAQGARGGPIATGGVGEAEPRHWFLHVLTVCLSLGPSGSSWLPVKQKGVLAQGSLEEPGGARRNPEELGGPRWTQGGNL